MKVIVNYREGHKLAHLLEDPASRPGYSPMTIPGPPVYGNTELIDDVVATREHANWIDIEQEDGTVHRRNRDWVVGVTEFPDEVWGAGLVD